MKHKMTLSQVHFNDSGPVVRVGDTIEIISEQKVVDEALDEIAKLKELLRDALEALKMEEAEDMKYGWQYTRISEITNKLREAAK